MMVRGREGRPGWAPLPPLPSLGVLLTLAATTALAAIPATGSAQSAAERSDEVRIEGRLLFGVDSLPVARAHVRVEGADPVRTDGEGRFTLAAESGERRLTAVVVDRSRERVYTALFRIPDRVRVGFTWWVGAEVDPRAATGRSEEDPIAVDGVVATVEADEVSERDHEAERSDHLDRAYIESLGPVRDVGDLVRRMVGVRVLPSVGGTVCIVPGRGRMQQRQVGTLLGLDQKVRGTSDRACPEMVTVVLDGLVLRDATHFVASIPPGDIESIRYLGGIAATQRYGHVARWGALVIETRTR